MLKRKIPGATQCSRCKCVTDHHNLTRCLDRAGCRTWILCRDCEVRLRELRMIR